MFFSKISTTTCYTHSTESSSLFYNQKTSESLEKRGNGTHTWTYVNRPLWPLPNAWIETAWTYVNQPLEYRVIASDKKVTIDSVRNGKKLEMTLDDDQATKVRNLLEKMHLPIRPMPQKLADYEKEAASYPLRNKEYEATRMELLHVLKEYEDGIVACIEATGVRI